MDAKQLKVEKTVTLLETMEDETLVKLINFTPADSIEAALKLLGNDQKRLLEVVNAGLESDLQASAKKDPAGWHTYKDDESGEINGPFTGDILDSKKVGAMVLTFAKAFGYSTIKDREKRSKVKESARVKVKALLQSDPEMRAAYAYAEDENDKVAE